MAARQALGITPPPADPLAPGPFAFADEQRLRGLLADAGFGDIELQRFDAPNALGASAHEAALNCCRSARCRGWRARWAPSASRRSLKPSNARWRHTPGRRRLGQPGRARPGW